MPTEVRAAGSFETWTNVSELLSGTPLADSGVEDLADPLTTPTQSRRSRLNVGLLFFTAQSIQIVFVTLTIFAFYVLLGVFLISPSTITLCTGGQPPGVVTQFALWENAIVLTGALLRCAAFIAAIAVLQFAVSALTDKGYREEFMEENTAEMRKDFAVPAPTWRASATAADQGGAGSLTSAVTNQMPPPISTPSFDSY